MKFDLSVFRTWGDKVTFLFVCAALGSMMVMSIMSAVIGDDDTNRKVLITIAALVGVVIGPIVGALVVAPIERRLTSWGL